LIGTRVRVREHHRMTEWRGMVGKIVGYYGGADDYVAVEVRLSGGDCRLFWLGDLEEISAPSPPLGGVPERLGQREVSTEDLLFPSFEYHLDESDPEIAVLRRQDDAFVGAFSARGATTEGIVEAAKEDYRELIRAHAESLGRDSEEYRSA
jgi:hypothetical protein